MSSAFDNIQYALRALGGDEDIQSALRFAIDALHDWDHKHNGILNRIVPFSRDAREAGRLAALAKAGEG